MDLEHAIRSRRTHKAFMPEPVARATLEELFELARWAPNHRLTEPWRFRVLGARALERLIAADGPGAERKLRRAPTLIVATALSAPDDPVRDEEDAHAAAIAAYLVLLAAHGRGLAGYWRTPAVLRTPEGRAAVGVGEGERVLGLLHLGRPLREQPQPERAAAEAFVSYLD